MARKMIANKVKCLHCNDIIQSFHRHQFVWCKCGKIGIDGGTSYGKRVFPELPMEDHIEDLSEYEEV